MIRFEYFPSCVYRDEQPEWVNYCLQATQKYYNAAQNDTHIAQTEHMADDPNF